MTILWPSLQGRVRISPGSIETRPVARPGVTAFVWQRVGGAGCPQGTRSLERSAASATVGRDFE